MPVIIERGGIRYGQSTVQIPLELKETAKERKISLSAVLTRALKEELEVVAV
jgi:post-segregation antitoxin (ccd killing protein)